MKKLLSPIVSEFRMVRGTPFESLGLSLKELNGSKPSGGDSRLPTFPILFSIRTPVGKTTSSKFTGMTPFFQLFGLDHLGSPGVVTSPTSWTAAPVHVTTVGTVRVSSTSTSSCVGQR